MLNPVCGFDTGTLEHAPSILSRNKRPQEVCVSLCGDLILSLPYHASGLYHIINLYLNIFPLAVKGLNTPMGKWKRRVTSTVVNIQKYNYKEISKLIYPNILACLSCSNCEKQHTLVSSANCQLSSNQFILKEIKQYTFKIANDNCENIFEAVDNLGSILSADKTWMMMWDVDSGRVL